ncbi:MAG TPA: hypothetical protein VM094_00890 [Gemmatimonadales bacterium]|nr:hypothetical protein [Gemmatimonadales bacterium]
MNRYRSGLVPLFALLVLVGCSSDPTDSLRNGPTELVATPTQLFIELGGVKTVEVGSVDAQGNPIDLNYEVTSTGAGITVRRDSSFLPIFVNDSTLQAPAVGPRFRFIVEGTGYATSSFTVSAGGLDLVVPVQVIPQTGLAATFDDDTLDLGQSVTLTAPAGITFLPTATVEIAGNPLIPVILAQDATSITFLPPPNVNSPITVNGVVSAGAPDVVFSPATDTPLVTVFIDTVDVTYSTVTPTLGQTVTLTVPEPLINLVVDSIVYPGLLPGRVPGPTNILVALDSSSLTFSAPPNAAGSGTVVNFAFPGGFLIALPTRPTFTSENIGLTLPAGFSNTSPAVSETVTMTAPAGFTFDPATVVTIGANPAILVARAADGSSIGIVPIPGSLGVPQIDGVVPTASPLNILTMAAEDTVTVPAEIPTLAGTDAPATAPSLTTPALGEASVLFDRPDFVATVDHFYKLVVPADATFDMTVDWNIGGDIDFVVCGGTCADPFGADLIGTFTTDPGTGGFQGATSAHPEFSTLTLTAGTYWILVEDFGGDAAESTVIVTLERTL